MDFNLINAHIVLSMFLICYEHLPGLRAPEGGKLPLSMLPPGHEDFSVLQLGGK